MQAHIVLDIHTLTQYNLAMHRAIVFWFGNLCDDWTNSSDADLLSSSSDGDMPPLEDVSHFITNNQLFTFLGYPIAPAIALDTSALPLHIVDAAPPCISFSAVQSQVADLFVAHDTADAYHHVELHHQFPPPPYNDPSYSSDDPLPDLVDDSSTDGYDSSSSAHIDGYDSSSSEESIPAHARYDVDSDIDDCRLGDQPSPDSEDELWNAEFWSTPDQGAYLLSPAAWASWQLANSVENGHDYDNYHDAHGHPDEAESDDDEFYGVAPPEGTVVTASSAALTICRILASGRQQLSPWNYDPAITVIDTAVLSTAPVTLASYDRTVSLTTLIVSWAIHADIYRNRYIRQFCPEALESLTCISNRDVIDCLSSVCVHERHLMQQALRKILFNWIISQIWERLLTNCRPEEILPALPPDDDKQ